MVTDTSEAPPATSEGAPDASLQEPPVVPPQEPGTDGEKGPVKQFWDDLGPEGRAEFIRQLSTEELHQHPEYEQALKRDQQSERDRVRFEQEEAGRRRQEQQTIRVRKDAALKKLGEEPSPEAAREAAEAIAAAEYYPSMLEEDDDAFRRLETWPEFTPDEQRAILATARDWREQRTLRYKALLAAATRVATEAADKKFASQRGGLEKAAHKLGYEQAARELRGEVPPRVGGGTPTGQKTYKDMTDEERAKLTPSAIDAMTAHYLENR